MSGGVQRRRGVVTACDVHYFPGLLALHDSVQASLPCEVVCYDLGLEAAQQAEAARRADLRVLPLPSDPLIPALIEATRQDAPLAKPGKRIWPLWICPLLIRAAPLTDAVWLDCDLLLLRGLRELFALLEDGPVFTPETLAPAATPNRPELYRHLPITRPFDPATPVVNGGVSAWRLGRDDAVLEAYIRPVAAAAANPAVREAISWHDQGALIWAIQSLGLEHRVVGPEWNLPVRDAGLPGELLAWDRGLLERLRAALPDVKVLHWNGQPAPWAGGHCPPDEAAATRSPGAAGIR